MISHDSQHTYIQMLNKNTWGVKKYRANQKQHRKQAGVTKGLISAEAKKLLYQIFVTP